MDEYEIRVIRHIERYGNCQTYSSPYQEAADRLASKGIISRTDLNNASGSHIGDYRPGGSESADYTSGESGTSNSSRNAKKVSAEPLYLIDSDRYGSREEWMTEAKKEATEKREILSFNQYEEDSLWQQAEKGTTVEHALDIVLFQLDNDENPEREEYIYQCRRIQEEVDPGSVFDAGTAGEWFDSGDTLEQHKQACIDTVQAYLPKI